MSDSCGKSLRYVASRRCFHRVTMWLAIVCYASVLHGQARAERDFYVLGYGEGLFEGIRYETTDPDGEKEEVMLEFIPDQRSFPYPLSENVDRLSFFAISEIPDGTEKRKIVGSVEIQSDGSDVLLIFLEDEGFQESGEYKILAFSESEENWGPGKFRLLNLSGAALQVDFGRERFELSDGSSKIVSFDIDDRIAQRLQIAVFWNGNSRDVLNTWLLPDRNYGKLLVLKPPLHAGSLKLRIATIW